MVHCCENFNVEKVRFSPQAIKPHVAKTQGGVQVELHMCRRDAQKTRMHSGGKRKEFIVQGQVYKIVAAAGGLKGQCDFQYSVLQLQCVHASVLCTGSYSVLMFQYSVLAATVCSCFNTLYWQLQCVHVSVLCTGSYSVFMFQYSVLETTVCSCFSTMYWQLQCVDVSVLCTSSYSVFMFSVIFYLHLSE